MKSKDEDVRLNLLAPKTLYTNDEGINNYFKNLKYLIESEKDTKNIAITGGYGTGKSSIIKTYIEKYSNEEEIAIISISSFLKTVDNKNEEHDSILTPDEKDLVDILEKTIIKQLIYRIGYSDSKLSNIPKPLYNWKQKYTFYSFLITLLSFIIVFLFSGNYLIEKFPMINAIKIIINLVDEYKYSIFSFLIIGTFIIIFFFIYNLLIYINHKKIKLKLVDNKLDEEFELDKSANENINFVFMEYIYEIIYFFQNSKIKTIFFEDIDRYGSDVCIKITEDLRELNLILNKCDGIDKKITFIYSLKDAIYSENTDRTKFFDYILSVLPISTSANALLNYSNEFNFYKIDYKDFSPELIKIAAYHIKDLRTIKSVVNDYYLFDKIINNHQKDKLLAMMLFKNNNLKDYDELLIKNKNLIDESIEKINEEVVKEIKTQIEEKKKELEIIKNNRRENIDEIKKLLLFNYRKDSNLPNKIYVYPNKVSTEMTIVEFLNDKFNLDLIDNNTRFYTYSSGIKNINEDDLKSFKESIHIFDSDISKLQKEIDDLEVKKHSEKYLIEEKRKIYLSKSENRILLDDLIYNGFIDNNYMNFVTSVLNDNCLSGNDTRFLNNVMFKNLDYSLKIDNIDKIIRHLNPEEYNDIYVLNMYFINELLNKEVSGFLEKIIEQFNNISKQHVDFLLYLKTNNINIYNKLLKKLSINSESIWNSYINQEKGIYYNNEIIIILDILMEKEIDIKKIDNIKILKNYIENHFTTGKYNLRKNEFIIQNLHNLDVKFEDISIFLPNIDNDIYDELLNEIISNYIYKINISNLKIVTKSENLNYSDIKKSNSSNIIIEYLKKNPLDTFKELYLKTNYLFELEDVIRFFFQHIPPIYDYHKIIVEKENIKFNKYIDIMDNQCINLAYTLLKLSINWDLIGKLIDKSNELHELIFYIIIEHKEDLLTKINTKILNSIPQMIIYNLVNYFSNNNDVKYAKCILTKMDQIEFKNRYTIKHDDSINKIKLYIKYNLLNYSDKNINLIRKKIDDKYYYKYIYNGFIKLKSRRLYKYMTLDILNEYKDILTVEARMEILRKNYKIKKYKEMNFNIHLNKIYYSNS